MNGKPHYGYSFLVIRRRHELLASLRKQAGNPRRVAATQCAVHTSWGICVPPYLPSAVPTFPPACFFSFLLALLRCFLFTCLPVGLFVCLTACVQAKLSGFGFTREANSELASTSSADSAARMYMDPAHAVTGKATAASDIYRWGLPTEEARWGKRSRELWSVECICGWRGTSLKLSNWYAEGKRGVSNLRWRAAP